MTHQLRTIRAIDSHTGGEPTRLAIDVSLDLGAGTVAQRLAVLRSKHDWLRTALVNEPRASDVFVGGLVLPPSNPAAAAGIIFFNNVGYLGMCGHGTIGLASTLAYLGRIGIGTHTIETPVGDVALTLHESGEASIRNVPSFKYRTASLKVPGIGTVTGDVAWGGNWFFLVKDHGLALALSKARELTAYAQAIRDALDASDIRGAGGAIIDHVELFGSPTVANAHSRNFVLCPGGAYDRSPCGTGTSAKLACLAESGELAAGHIWVQESIVGSTFRASYERVPQSDGQPRHAIIPTITGRAFVNADLTVILNTDDPFALGIVG